MPIGGSWVGRRHLATPWQPRRVSIVSAGLALLPEQAVEEIGQAGAPPGFTLIAHSHLGLRKLYRRTGRRHEAQEHVGTATTLYREMDMRCWLEQAEADRDT